MDLDYDGLMIELHPDPDSTWSDAQQQVSAASLQIIIESLILRQVKPEDISYDTLEDLRFKIDKYDNELLDILQKRMEVAESIGAYKKQTNRKPCEKQLKWPMKFDEPQRNTTKKMN